MFYSGIAVISDSLRELDVCRRIMESDSFFNYIKNITKDYSFGYISMNKNYVKNFGICDLTEEEKDMLLETQNPVKLLRQFYRFDDPYEIADIDFVKVAEPNMDDQDVTYKV